MPDHQAEIYQLQAELRDLHKDFLSEKAKNEVSLDRLTTRINDLELIIRSHRAHVDKRIDEFILELDTHHEQVLQAITRAEIDLL